MALSNARLKTARKPARKAARPDAPPFLLTVLTGPHAGAELRLKDGTVSLGAGDADDLALEGTAPGAVRIALRGAQARIRPAPGRDLSANYAAPCPADRTTRLALPLRLQLDDRTAIHLCRLTPVRTGWAGLIPTAFVGLVAGGLGMLATTQVDLGPPAAAQVAVAPAAPVQAVASVEKAPACTTCVVDAATDLRRMLDDAGLAGVAVTHDAEVVRAGGAHAASEATAWGVVRRTYDEAWGSRVPLVVAVAVVEPDVPFAVESVWLGADPEVRTREGAIFGLGDETPGGWRVETIRAGLVGLRRAGDQMQIAF